MAVVFLASRAAVRRGINSDEELLLAALAIFCSLAAVAYVWHVLRRGLTARDHLPWVHGAAVGVVIALLLATGWKGCDWAAKRVLGYQQRDLLQQAEALARAIDPRRVETFGFTAEDLHLPAYHRLCAQMTAYAKVMGWRHVQGLAWRHGGLLCGPASVPTDGAPAALPGSLYRPVIPLTNDRAAAGGHEFVRGVRADPGGTVVVARTAVYGPRPGSVPMVLEVVVDATSWAAAARRARLAPALAVLAILALLFWGEALLERRHGLAPGAHHRWRHTEAALCAAIGLVLTLATAWVAHRNETDLHAESFDRLALAHAGAIGEALLGLRDHRLPALAEYIRQHDDLSREQYAAYARILSRAILLHGVAWARRVGAEERAEFEAAMRREGVGELGIHEIDEAGQRRPAPRRPVHFPLTYIEPFPERQAAVGFDLLSESRRADALWEAASTGMVTASDMVRTAGDRAPVIMVYAPVKGRAAAAVTASTLNAWDAGETRGFALIALRPESLLEHALRREEAEGASMLVALHQLRPDGTSELLATTSPDAPEVRLRRRPSQDDLAQHRLAIPVPVFGKAYALTFQPSPHWLAAHRPKRGREVAFLGLGLTVVVTALVGVLAVHSDTLELQVRARTAELQASQERFAQISELSREVIWEVDPQGVYTYVSRACHTVSGYDPEELVGKLRFYDLHPPEGREEFRREAMGTIARGEPFADLHNQIMAKNGEILDMLTTGIAIRNDAGELRGYRGSDRDITEIKRAETALRLANRDLAEATAKADALAVEARRASAAKSEFLAAMSHEIRTPMNGVIGMLDLLLEGDLTDAQRRSAEAAKESGSSLMRIIGDILDFSKIEAGRMELESLPTDIRAVLGSITGLLGGQARAKGLALTCRVDQAVPPLVMSDPVRLRQVITNLAANGVKFTERGQVWLQVDCEALAPRSATLRFTIRDTGIGIPPDKRSLLFRAFAQVDASTARRYGGTGLGLAISQNIVRMMGGTIRVESREGEGSEFWFSLTFPVPAAAEALPSPKASPVPLSFAHRRVPILVAEDNETNQTVAVSLLGRLGLNADVVRDGREALEALSERPYGLVLMDVRMPNLDGLETTRRIRNTRSSVLDHRVPIIALTAHAMAGDREECLAAGMDDYLPKPLERAALAAALDRWLPGAPRTAAEAGAPSPPAAGGAPEAARELAVFDRRSALRRLDGDEELLRVLVDGFVQSTPDCLKQLRDACAVGDADSAGRHAHAIKGASASVGAEAMRQVAAEIEAACRGQALPRAVDRVPELEEQYHRFLGVLGIA